MKISIDIKGLADVQAQIKGFSDRRMAAALATALTRTARAVSQDWQAQIDRRIDRPNARTRAAAMFIGAQAGNLSATVLLKDQMSGTAPAGYLAPQEYGGSRKVKQFERALISSGAMPSGYVTVPGKGAKRDSFGNVSKAQLIAVIRQLGQDYSPGYAQTISKSTSKRLASMAKHGRRYIVVRPGEQRRSVADAGIYERMADGRRKAIFLFKARVTYGRRLDLIGSSSAMVGRVLQGEVERAIGEAAGRLAGRGAA